MPIAAMTNNKPTNFNEAEYLCILNYFSKNIAFRQSASYLACWEMEANLLSSPKKLERDMGFEPTTSTFARRHSTIELIPLLLQRLVDVAGLEPAASDQETTWQRKSIPNSALYRLS